MTIDDVDFKQVLDAWSWKRQDFLTLFSHPEHGDPREGVDVLNDDSYWTVRKCRMSWLLTLFNVTVGNNTTHLSIWQMFHL